MSYLSRLFNHRNTQQPEKKKGFFSHRKADKKASKNGFFQAKLSVNEPGDVHEKEADKAADAVVHRKEVNAIQRLSTPAEDEKLGTNDARIKKDKDIQEKPMEKHDKDKMVQKKEEYGGSTASSMLSAMIETSAGKGTPLPQKILTEMNSAFGVDFSCVRLHTDHEAAAMCHELGAQAFTHGADIYFNEGKYDPESSAGKHLLSHELTHVIQQLGLSKQAAKHGK